MVELAAATDDPAPALRGVEDLKRHRNTLAAEVGRREREYIRTSLLELISVPHAHR